MSAGALAPVLLVEPNDVVRHTLHDAVIAHAKVESYGEFISARARCLAGSFDFLVTNMRLGAYNGLHLAYLCMAGLGTPRVIVYTDARDAGLAREVQRAGAFYEVGTCLPITLAAYLTGLLPARDRRQPAIADRRRQTRGGRRCWDRHVIKKDVSLTS
jgi:DNA-binding NtrC family response regulator